MNKLSWILYCSDLLPSIGTASTLFCVLLFVPAVALSLCSVYLNTDSSRPDEITRWDGIRKRCADAARPLRKIVAVLLVLAVIVPSKTTIMAVAASEISEMAIKSEAGQEIANDALAAVKSWLKSQLPKPEK